MPPEIELVNEQEDGAPQAGMALCLSGGGYRAMLFHLGTLWRLYEAGLLDTLARISSVSGGSITSAALALAWPRLSFDPADLRNDFLPEVVDPVRALAGTTIDSWSIGTGVLLPGSVSDRVAAAYREYLFGEKTLQDLPAEPRFVFNATSLQSGVLCRFSRPFMWDYRVGKIADPKFELAVVVAASSAFPPVLSPCVIDVEPTAFEPGTGTDLQREPYTSELVLTDGGVYDNLGLETVWKNYRTVFVSDAGGQMAPEEEPARDWARQSMRVLDVIDNQVRSLRKRQLIGSYVEGARAGAYWGIRTNIADYHLVENGLEPPLDAPFDRTMELALTPTRLKRLPERHQERLINWGYAVCDAALRRHHDQTIPRGVLPYPQSEI